MKISSLSSFKKDGCNGRALLNMTKFRWYCGAAA
jgi:hypothetical protein